MKKTWKRILAVAAVLALALCVLSSCGDNTQAKIDEAVKKTQDAADVVKAELEGKVADLTKQLEEAPKAEDIAAQVNAAVEDAKAAAAAEMDEALKAASDAPAGPAYPVP